MEESVPKITVARVLCSVWVGILLPLAFLLCFICQAALWVLLFPLFIRSRYWRVQILGTCLRFWCVSVGFFVNPFWWLKVVRPPPPRYKPSRTLIMVNHLSAADPWVVARAIYPWELKWVFKGDLMKVPIAGWCIYMGGDLPVYFTKAKGGWGTDSAAIKRMFDKCLTYQDNGIGTVIFPEGTRSKSGRLQPFKPGFFKFAIENGVEVLPCVLHDTSRLWPRGQRLLGVGTAYFSFGDPIKVEQDETVEGLIEKVKNNMLELLKEMPSYDPDIDGKPLTKFEKTRGNTVT